MNEGMPQNNRESLPGIEEIEAKLEEAKNYIDTTAPGIQEKRLGLDERKAIILDFYDLCRHKIASHNEKSQALLGRNDVNKTGEEIRENIRQAHEYIRLAHKCLEVEKILTMEEAKFSDSSLGFYRVEFEMLGSVLKNTPDSIQYYREGGGKMEEVRKELERLEETEEMMRGSPLEVQNMYPQDLAKLTFYIEQLKKILKDRASVNYQEGIGLIVDEEVKKN
jgi:hypothetical protein